MPAFKNLSINLKLNLLVMVAGGVATLLACGTFIVNDTMMIRQSKVRQLSALADVLGSNSTAALTFDDPATGKELLSSLRAQPTVEFACLYNADGKVFATYGGEPDGTAPPSPGPAGHRFTKGGYLDVTGRIIQDKELIGTIYLHASMSDLREKYLQSAYIAVVVIVVSLGGSILLSGRLQRAISLPILRLAATAQEISAGGDYSIRVEKGAEDELGTLYDAFNGMLEQIERGERELHDAHDQLETRVEERTRQLSQANVELSREVAERKRAESELEETHRQLIQTARQAGMAEVATDVLHNVGNVLNSINVSATLVADRLRRSKISEFDRAVGIMREHSADLGTFITSDEKGKLLPGFLNMLSEHLEQERTALLQELRTLVNNVDHVKTIVAMQQSYAGVAGMVEAVSLAGLIEDALKFNLASSEKHGIKVVRHYDELPDVRVDKQKLLQILVNLITNAKDALVAAGEEGRQLTVRILRAAEDRVRIEVTDSGIGIPSENLTRIFSHGFTTKQHGHGFGLHASANAANEMGGRLTATSDGPGRGATFSLELPLEPTDAALTGA